MNSEQLGVLLVSTINTTNNDTARMISNPNIGKLYLYSIMLSLLDILKIKLCTYVKLYADHWFYHFLCIPFHLQQNDMLIIKTQCYYNT